MGFFFPLAIDEVGGVPYEILEPVLERCTPEQLYRIEQCNQVCICTKASSHIEWCLEVCEPFRIVSISA